MIPSTWTNTICKSIGPAMLCVAAVFAGTHSEAQTATTSCGENLPLSGTFTFDGQSVSVIVGVRWGKGVLTLNDGTQLAFSANGIRALESGVRVGTVSGEVYGIEQTSDFTGKYVGTAQQFVPGKSQGDVFFVNSTTCVALVARADSSGVKLSAPTDQEVNIKFR